MYYHATFSVPQICGDSTPDLAVSEGVFRTTHQTGYGRWHMPREEETLKPIIFAATIFDQDIDEATDGTAGYVMAGSLLG